MGGTAAVPGRGRRPKPTAVKVLSGNPGKRAINKEEPQFTEITHVDAPEWMGELATTMWETLVPELLKQKILRITDLHNVEAFCMAYQRWREAEEEITFKGITVTGAMGGPIKNPALTASNEARRQMVQFGSLLGLDPSSRARLTGAGQKKKENEFTAVLSM